MPSEEIADKQAQNRAERRAFIDAWAEYVRTHPDEQWGKQVNKLVEAQLERAQAREITPDDFDSRELSATNDIIGDETTRDEGPAPAGGTAKEQPDRDEADTVD